MRRFEWNNVFAFEHGADPFVCGAQHEWYVSVGQNEPSATGYSAVDNCTNVSSLILVSVHTFAQQFVLDGEVARRDFDAEIVRGWVQVLV